MNKVFQINLAGVIFNIDENAYQKLLDYITALKNNFASEPDVVTDIQHRMAELFLQKVGSDKIIYITHVDEIIGIMGHADYINEESGNTNKNNYVSPLKIKRLRRNPYDDSLGGVCGGIAAFFGVDPIIIRILFVVSAIIYGTGILFYLVLWVILPKATGEDADAMFQQKNSQTKKLFRNADDRLIGGVCSGISGYFGFDIIWVRIFFIVLLFLFGSGFWLYIILWVMLPQALSAAEKLLMRGINPSVKNIQQFTQTANSLNTKGINKTGRLVKSVGKLFLGFIAFWVFVVIVAFSVATIAFYFGVGNIDWLNHLFNITFTDKSVLWAGKIGVLLCILIPLIALLLILLKLIFHIKNNIRVWLLSLTVLFICGVGFLMYAGISFGSAISYKNTKNKLIDITPNDTLVVYGIASKVVDGEFSATDNDGEITIYNKGILVENNQLFLEIDYFKISQLSYGNKPVLKVTYQSNGKNATDANEHIKEILFEPRVEGEKIYIPHFFSIKPNGSFRWQEVSLELFVPQETIVIIDETARDITDDSNMDEADGSIYKMQNGTLICKNCQAEINQDKINNTINEEVNIEAGPIKIKIKDDSLNENVDINLGDNDAVKTEKKVIYKNGKKITIEESKAGPVKILKRTTEKAELP